MKTRIVLIVAAFAIAFVFVGVVLAQPGPPPLPSSFWGIAKVNGVTPPDGTLVTAWINGVQYASTKTMSYPGWGSGLYALNVPGDQTGTPQIEGGVQGDAITFKVGGLIASPTGTWRGGTNTRLDLTASTFSRVKFLNRLSRMVR